MSNGQNIVHFNALRFRVTGNGALKLKLSSLDNVFEQSLPDLQLKDVTNVQPTVPCNFIEQKAALEFKTTNIDDYFRINRVIIFSREIFSSFPQ